MYKCKNVKLGIYDRRFKLSEGEKLEIIAIREQQGLSYKKIGEMFSVSGTLVNKICNKEYNEKQKENSRKLISTGLYKETKEKRNAREREYWEYKNKLYKEGKI